MILLLDDEPGMGRLVEMCVADLDIAVTQVEGLDDALAAARKERPAILMLDLALSGTDGLDVLPLLRADPALTGVPVVVFSVHGSREREARRHGVDGFVRKPFAFEALRSTLRPFLEGGGG